MKFGAIELLDRHGRLEPELTPSGLKLRGETQWKLIGPEDEIAAVADALPESMVERLGSGLLLDFGNAVGRFDVPRFGVVEVSSGKWGETSFEAMLADLVDRMSALPFSANEAAKLPYDRQLANHPLVLYQAFVYLRHALTAAAPRSARLVPALEAVVREPHSRLAAMTRRTDIQDAAVVDLGFMERLAAGAEPMSRAPLRARGLPVVQALRGHLPDDVVEARTFRNYDTAENRFVKSFVILASAILDRMESIARRHGQRFWRRVLSNCAEMRRLLAPYEHADFWRSVGRMTHLPAASTVLQQRRGYRDVYRHYLRLRATTRLPMRRRALVDLLEAKDIAQLYELWCYFQAVDAISSVAGTKPVRADGYTFSDTQVGLRWDFRVEWPGNIRCYYNLRFSRSRGADRKSYSVPLRPDIVLDHPAAGLHAFDAKFRVVQKQAGRATFKRADLYKMHAYRDALPLRSARILYPGTDQAFYEVPGAPGDGVGAVPLVPDGDGGELRAVIARLRER